MLVTQRDAIKGAYEKHTISLDRPVGLYGLDWGHHDWNMATAGAIPGTITSVAAKSGHGKTAALIQVMKAANEVVDGLTGDILFFTWEMSAIGNIERYVCHESGITMQQYRYAKMLPDFKRDDILKAYSKAASFNIKYHQSSTDIDTVLSICADRRKEVKTRETIEGVRIQQIIIVDYVSLAAARQKSYGNKTYDIGDFMKTFKQEANAKGYAGLFLGQVKRDTEGEPGSASIQDSSQIYQNSDNVIIMHRPEADMGREVRDPENDQMVSSKDRVMFRFVKTREGQPQDVLAHCDMRYFRFWHRHHKFETDYAKLYTDEEFWKREYGL